MGIDDGWIVLLYVENIIFFLFIAPTIIAAEDVSPAVRGHTVTLRTDSPPTAHSVHSPPTNT